MDGEHPAPPVASTRRLLVRIMKSRLFIAIIGVIGSLIGVYYGKWSEQPIRQSIPPELKVWLPLEPDLTILSSELPTWYLMNKPEMMPFPFDFNENARPRSPFEGTDPKDPKPGMMLGPVGGVAYLPISFQQVSVEQLHQLYQLSEIPPEMLVDMKNKVESFPKEHETRKKEMLKWVDHFTERNKAMPKAKVRIKELEDDWRRKYGIFSVDILVTNSVGRATSLALPASLHFEEGENDATLELNGKAG